MRLYYSGEVVRYEPPKAGRQSELHQMGLEHLGGDARAADAEVLAIAAECLDRLGARGFVLALGHVGVFGGLVEGAGLDAERLEALRERVESKDPAGVREALEGAGVPAATTAALERLTAMAGGLEVLDEAARAFAFCAPAAAAVAELRAVASALRAAGLADRLAVDLGEVRGLDYYTGLVFRVFAPGLGFEVGGGGRYDTLLARFGRPLPAVGFMLGLDRVALLLERQGGCVEGAGRARRRHPRPRPGRGARQARRRARGRRAGPLRKRRCDGEPHRRPLEGQAARRVGGALPPGGPAVPRRRRPPARRRRRATCASCSSRTWTCRPTSSTASPTAASPAATCCSRRAPTCSSRSTSASAAAGSWWRARRARASRPTASATTRVATKYARVAAAHFLGRGLAVEVVKLAGSVEIAPGLGLADCIVDVVETGRTLAENGLEVLETVAESSARLIVNRASFHARREEVRRLVEALRGASR